MTPVEPPPATSVLAEAIRGKLQNAPAPLKLAEVVKGLPKGKKVKPADMQADVRHFLEEEVRLGRAFCYPSGKNTEVRYWSHDEKQILRGKAVELASTPETMSSLKTKLGKAVKGTDGAFIETIVRELIATDRLFEYPPKTKTGGPQFGARRPPPPLENAKHQKALDKLAADCRKLMSAAGVRLEVLVAALHARLIEFGRAEAVPPRTSTVEVIAEATPSAVAPATPTTTAETIRTALRQAYDRLCCFREFQNGLVELPRLYDETARAVPSLTLDNFRREVESLWEEKKAELHILNEVREATEPHKAIQRDNKLYYFMYWRTP
jgi:hypothetical protein